MFITCLISLALAQGPVWPDVFQADFTELNKEGLVKAHTSGSIYYDFPNRQYRIDRDNGIGDRYCGTTKKLRNTPCSHIVKDEKRYLYFPNLGDCCFCCDAEHGCGVLLPNWAEDSTFVGYDIDFNNNEVEKWEKKGLQPNYIYATRDNQVITQIDQMPNSFLYFLLNSYSNKVDPSHFVMPDICVNAKNCGLTSICSQLRNEPQVE